MKSLFFSVLFCLMCISLSAQVKSSVKFIPEKPRIGDSLTIIFTPGTNSPLLKADSVLITIMFYGVSGGDKIEEYYMKKIGSSWMTSFRLNQSNSSCLVFHFNDPDWDNFEDNDHKAWDILIYNDARQPVKGAYNSRGDSYQTGSIVNRNQNLYEYHSNKKKENEIFPGNERVLNGYWWASKLLSTNQESLNLIIKKDADELMKKHPDSLSILKLIHEYYKDIDEAKDAEILKKIEKLEPVKKENLSAAWDKIVFLPPGENRLKASYDFFIKSKGSKWEKSAHREYYKSMIGAHYYEQAIKFLNEWEKPDYVEIILSGAQILETCKALFSEENGKDLLNKIKIDDKNEKAIIMAKQAKELVENAISQYQQMDVKNRGIGYTPSAWRDERKEFVGVGFSIAAEADYLLKDYSSAIKNYKKSLELLKDEFFSPKTCTDYIKSLFQLKNYSEAFETAIKIFEKNNWDKFSDIKDILFASAKELKTSRNDVQKKLDEISENNKIIRTKEINENFKKQFRQSPDFNITDISGNKYSSIGMNGKIIIIEFWNTQCGWCEKSASYFQKFYLKHKNDKDLAILSINCNPATNENDKEKLVTDFIEKKMWKFPIAIDFKNKVSTKFRNGFVPVTYFIGPDGYIYYTEVGFPGVTMVEDFEKIVDMIKKDIK